MKTSKLCEIIDGQFLNKTEDQYINSISIDSRTALGKSDEVFFALKGNHLDGHEFVDELIKKGTINFIVDRRIEVQENVNLILVDDVLLALQSAAKFKRQKFDGQVIGITGSNGKTIVKEWLATLLENDYNLVKSPGSFNSQIGVALSTWQLNNKADLGIFEAGISMPHEMAKIESLIRPQLGIFTNIGPAHQENFNSYEEKIKEKMKLFSNCDTLILRADNEQIYSMAKEIYPNRTLSWTTDIEQPADVMVQVEQGLIRFRLGAKEFKLESTFNDEASIENLIHSLIAAAYLGQGQESIQSGVNNLSTLKMRLKAIKGTNGNYILDDSYTNDLGGLVKALDFMEKQGLQKSRVLILSDFGTKASPLKHLEKLAQLLTDKHIDQFIGIGEQLTENAKLFASNASFFPDVSQFLSDYPLDDLKDRLILVKGSRKFKFERILSRLVQRLHKTSLEIDLDKVVKNLSTYRSKLQSSTKLMVMVKALAYGAGSFEIARILEYHKVDYLAVAYTDEGKELREKGIHIPIMVMNASQDDGPTLAAYNLEPEVFSIDQLKSYIQDFRFLGKDLNVHVILNTGMNRLGFEEENIEELNRVLHTAKDVNVKSIFTHLAAADENAHRDFTIEQVKKFISLSKRVDIEQANPPLKHVLNSSGIAAFSEYQMDMVRLGIGLYGLDPTNHIQNELVFPSHFKTTISQIRAVKKGESIGYGRNGIAARDSKIATIAVGYADGYTRMFGNGKAKVNINGRLVPTIGNICMDMTMVDVTDIHAKEGDEVVLFGEKPTINDLAKAADTIPYEILTNINSRVKRVFFAE